MNTQVSTLSGHFPSLSGLNGGILDLVLLPAGAPIYRSCQDRGESINGHSFAYSCVDEKALVQVKRNQHTHKVTGESRVGDQILFIKG